VSVAESSATARASGGARLAACAFDIVEIAALRGQAPQLTIAAARSSVSLPPLGRVAVEGKRMALCVRPERWLLLTPRSGSSALSPDWHARLATAVDLSCALSAFHLAGTATEDILVRGCRLDLDPNAFPVGHAAATIMAQVSVMLARLASGTLLLTPSTTAQHFHEWLLAAGRPFGLSGERSS
jgi:sarcosine oxidase subunit gamma